MLVLTSEDNSMRAAITPNGSRKALWSFPAAHGLIGLEDRNSREKACADSHQEAFAGDVATRAPKTVSSLRLVVGGLLFVVLTVGVFWYQFARIQAGDQAPQWSQLQWEYFLLILLCLPIDTLSSGLRIWVVCRVLQPGVSFWTCLKAEFANLGMSVLTPSQSGGGLGQVYMLNKGGARLGTAFTISLISFLGSVVGLLCAGLYSAFVSETGHSGHLFQGAIWSFTVIGGLMALGAVWPGLFRVGVGRVSKAISHMLRKDHHLQDWWPPDDSKKGPPVDCMSRLAKKLVDFVYAYRHDVIRFLRLGKASFLCVCLLSLAFIFSRSLMAFVCLRFLGVEASNLAHVLEIQIMLTFLIYFAPTPGGSGFAEGASLSLMVDIVPKGFAPYYNLLWRSATLYLPAIAGLACLLYTIAKDARKYVCRLRVFERAGAPGLCRNTRVGYSKV